MILESENKFKNTLDKELSPYLLQHANQPIAWQGWNENLFTEAELASKLIIISIGYASCHWCHVMAHESFDDPEVAALMNASFISIKVDREERPDVDRIYMQALQMITGQGGWPLNIVALPNGHPIWGTTYLPKEQWKNALEQIIKLSEKNPKKLEKQAGLIIDGLKEINSLKNNETEEIPLKEFNAILYKLLKHVDGEYGGRQGAPKFMMPVVLDYYNYAGGILENKTAKDHYHNTLKRMAWGGIFDAVGGGFSRYSVDERWHVPHFEKMGYDNGQLLHTYSDAYRSKPDHLYKEVVKKTVDFLIRELLHPEGGFYAALDADSKNNAGIVSEGAHYVWSLNELKKLLADDFSLFQKYYNVNSKGVWETDTYVLIRTQDDAAFCKDNNLTLETLKEKKKSWHSTLLENRNLRDKPNCDDKCICSWNALICTGLLTAYRVFKEEKYAILAKNSIAFIENYFISDTGGLFRIYKDKQQRVLGLAEDFATLIQMYINAYETFFDPDYLLQAKQLMEFCIENFKSKNTELFRYTNRLQSPLLLNQIEIEDNVIPSSNALMAENLIRLSAHFNIFNWREQAEKMLTEMATTISTFPSSHAKWLGIGLLLKQPRITIVVVGEAYQKVMKKLQIYHQPHIHWAGSTEENTLPLMKHRHVQGKTVIYWCQNERCELPETSVQNIIEKLKKITL